MGGKHGLCCCNYCCTFCRECDVPFYRNVLDEYGNLIDILFWMNVTVEFDGVAWLGGAEYGCDCSSQWVEGYLGNAPELPSTLADLSDINGIEFTVAQIPCNTAPYDLCASYTGTAEKLESVVRPLLEVGDTFNANLSTVDDEGSNTCQLWGQSYSVFVCDEELSPSTFSPRLDFWFCTSELGRRVLVVQVLQPDVGFFARYGAVVVGDGKVACDGLSVYVPLDTLCEPGPYDYQCWDLTGITVRLYAGW